MTVDIYSQQLFEINIREQSVEAVTQLPTSIDEESDALADYDEDYDQSDCEYGTEVCSDFSEVEDSLHEK